MTIRPRQLIPRCALSVLLAIAAACGHSERSAAPTAVTRPAPKRPWLALTAPAARAPIAFVGATASGGQDVKIGAVESQVEVRDPVAWAETKIRLDNQGKKAAEGALEVVLPAGTFVAETAEGDPMTELAGPTDRGERLFLSRAVAIPAGGSREIILHVATLVEGDGQKTALRFGRGAIGDRKVTLTRPASGTAPPPMPEDAVELTADPSGALKIGGFSVRRDRAPEARPAPPSKMVLMLDTSARRARDLPREAELVREVAGALPAETMLVVAAFDEGVTKLYEGPAGALSPSVRDAIAERGALGRANPSIAISFALAEAGLEDRVAIVTDALGPTALDPGPMARQGAAPRLDVVVPSGPSSLARISKLAESYGARPGRIAMLRDERASATLLAADPRPEAAPRGPTLPGPLARLGSGASAITFEPTTAADAGVPAWVGEGLSAFVRGLGETVELARVSPASLESSARPFLGDEVDVEMTDPLSTLKERPPATTSDAIEVVSAREDKSPPKTKPEKGKKQQNEKAEAKAKETAPSIEADPRKPTLPPDTIQQIVRRNFGRFRGCYQQVIRLLPQAAGKLVVSFTIDPNGEVTLARALSSDIKDVRFITCMIHAFEALSFPASDREPITVKYPFALAAADAKDGPKEKPYAAPMFRTNKDAPPSIPPPLDPWTGDAKVVYDATARGAHDVATRAGRARIDKDPDGPLGYVLLGDARRAANDAPGAMRAYASLLDLAAGRAAWTRLGAERVRGSGADAAIETAKTSIERLALADPADPTALVELAHLRARKGELESALRLLDVALAKTKDAKRYPGLRDLVRADLGMVGAALVAKQPGKKRRIERWLADIGVTLAEPGLLVVATWSQPGTDVDLRVRDRGLFLARKGEPNLPTGGRLEAAAADAPGLEAFVLDRVPSNRSYPYQLSVALSASDAPFVAGAVEAMELDGAGKLAFREAPFVVEVVGAELSTLVLDRSFFE